MLKQLKQLSDWLKESWAKGQSMVDEVVANVKQEAQEVTMETLNMY